MPSATCDIWWIYNSLVLIGSYNQISIRTKLTTDQHRIGLDQVILLEYWYLIGLSSCGSFRVYISIFNKNPVFSFLIRKLCTVKSTKKEWKKEEKESGGKIRAIGQFYILAGTLYFVNIIHKNIFLCHNFISNIIFFLFTYILTAQPIRKRQATAMRYMCLFSQTVCVTWCSDAGMHVHKNIV